MIRTPDQRLRVFVSSTLAELAEERAAVRRAVDRLHLSPVMFELGARPHPPRDLYRAYLAQSHVFVGIYWQRYGWVAPGESFSGLEDEFRLSVGLPQLIYIKEPAPEREDRLTALLTQVQSHDQTSYRRFRSADELEQLVADDLAVLLSERFHVPDDPTATAAAITAQPVPAALTPILGREPELDRVLELMTGGARLVTVTGPGGVGKTRLALEVAHVLQAGGREPVHFVALAPVTSPALVMSTVAEKVGAGEITGLRPVEWLAAHLGSSMTVLVLDNLEQVIEVAPEVAELLDRAPGLRLLCTSRQPLRLRGEQEVALGPLRTPDLDVDDVAEITDVPAVRLLLDRASAAGASVDLSGGHTAALAEVSRRLGGLPLALELVAARLRLLSPQQLLERLGSMLDVSGALTDLPARQQTLRATLDWSHELLSGDEQNLFADLGVFAGGATLEAIEEVCGESSADVLEALAGLLDKSLVRTVQSSGGAPRFAMLEPVAEYARQRLAGSDRERLVRSRHLDYYGRLGRRAQPFLCGPGQREWAGTLDAERPNLRVAIETGFAAGADGVVLRLVWDTLVYFYIRDGMDEPRRWVRRLAADRDALDRTSSALLDVALAVVGDVPPSGDPAGSLVAATRELESAELDLEAAVAQHHLGVWLWTGGDRDGGIAALADASRRYAALGHDWGVATVETTLGAVLTAAGDPGAAVGHHLRSLERARRIRNRPLTAQALQGLALVDAVDGRPDDAARQLAEALAIVLQDRMTTVGTYCLETLAGVVLAHDDALEAVRLFAAARSTRQRLSIPEWTAAADAANPLLARARRSISDDAWAQAWRDGEDGDVFLLLQTLGERRTHPLL